MKYEVTLTSPSNIDTLGFQARLKGLKVRDCLLMLEPGHKVRLGLLTRPAMESTVVESVVRGHGSVLDIDGSRVETDENTSRTNGSTAIWGENMEAKKGGGHDEGRFPTNLILKHGNDCYCDGTKKVGSGPEGGYSYSESTYAVKGFVPSCKPSVSSNRGTEEVPNWICQPSCPVRILDGQSGTLKSGKDINPTKESVSGFFGNTMGFYSKEANYGDSGGASRFFKQVQSEDELDEYLNRLVREGK